MKILSVGDIHGRDNWMEIEDISILMKGTFEPDFDKYIFAGDYCDSFTISNAEILHNLKQLIEFKKKYPEHVELLLGNHDIQYMSHTFPYIISGYRFEAHFDLFDIFSRNRELFKTAYQEGNYLWTHAGVNKTWYNDHFLKIKKKISQKFDVFELADILNIAHDRGYYEMWVNGLERDGAYKTGGPFWSHITEMQKEPIDGYIQIIGHTWVKEKFYHKINEDTGVWFIDTMTKKKSDCLILDI